MERDCSTRAEASLTTEPIRDCASPVHYCSCHMRTPTARSSRLRRTFLRSQRSIGTRRSSIKSCPPRSRRRERLGVFSNTSRSEQQCPQISGNTRDPRYHLRSPRPKIICAANRVPSRPLAITTFIVRCLRPTRSCSRRSHPPPVRP